MKCKECGRKAVIDLRYMNKALCGKCFQRLYEKRVRKTIRNNGMLAKHDRIAAGVSGGKDSLDLLYLLDKRKQNVIAITIDEGIKGYRDKTMPYVEEFCQDHDIPWHVFSFKQEYGFTLDNIARKAELLPCSYCGVFRRELLNKKARELGCTKVATGHNLDDEVQSVMMNFYRGDMKRFARTGPITGVVTHEKFIPRVKPLRECTEKENVVYALLNGIKYEDAECPYIVDAYRAFVRNQINEMEERYPGTKLAILKNADKLVPVMKELHKNDLIYECPKCGEPTSGEKCKACEMRKEAKRIT